MKKSTMLLALLAAVIIFTQMFVMIKIAKQESMKENLTQRILDNEFKLGIYAALLTMRDENMLCPGKFNFFELRDLSIEKQDSLRTILSEDMR